MIAVLGFLIGIVGAAVIACVVILMAFHLVGLFTPKKTAVQFPQPGEFIRRIEALKEERGHLRWEDLCDWKRQNEIDAEIVKLEERLVEPEKDPYLEYGEAEVEMLLS